AGDLARDRSGGVGAARGPESREREHDHPEPAPRFHRAEGRATRVPAPCDVAASLGAARGPMLVGPRAVRARGSSERAGAAPADQRAVAVEDARAGLAFLLVRAATVLAPHLAA